ncbi:rhamnogalacturonan acetylesterase [Planctomycetes bacterium CA13]
MIRRLTRRGLFHMASQVLLLALLLHAGNLKAELRPLPEPEKPSLPSLILIGDSTVRNGDGSGGNGQWGWGEPLRDLFDSSKLNVVNCAVGGLSSRTYLTNGYWERTKAHLKPGDFLIMQFGHNDASAINDDQRARGTIRGSGDEAEEIVNQLTGKPETVHTYGWYLRRYIQDAQAKGANPIVCSPVPRKSWNGDSVNRATTSYSAWARQTAESEGVPYIDLNDIIAEHYESIGQTKVEALFADKHTHTSLRGAQLNAECLVAGLLALKNGDLVRHLSQAGQSIDAAKAVQVITPDPRPILDDSSVLDKMPLREAIPTFYIMGDSTVRNGYRDGVGWGEVIGRYFSAEKLNVVNRAIGGRSTRTYMREKRWEDIFNQLRPGDFVIMQFGHNDGGRVGDIRFKRRPALAGTGDDAQEVTLDDGSVEVVHTYGWYLKQICTGVKEKQAVPIICSPIPHKNNWHEGHFEPDFAEHRAWCRQVAEATGAYFIDLTTIIGDRYQQFGEVKVNTLFADARTHTNAEGAKVNAECVIAGLKLLPTQPLDPFLRSE